MAASPHNEASPLFIRRANAPGRANPPAVGHPARRRARAAGAARTDFQATTWPTSGFVVSPAPISRTGLPAGRGAPAGAETKCAPPAAG